MASAGFRQIKPEPIRLSSEKLGITPLEFYLNNITDDRPVQASVAKLFLAQPASKPLMYPVDLYGGGYEAIRNFMFHSLTRNTTLRPVNVRIKECNILETLQGGNRVSGKVTVVFQYDLEKDWGNIPLTQYRAIANYTRSVNDMTVVEPSLRKLLVNSLKFINTWMNNEAHQNVLLARRVKLSFTDYLDQDADTVYYQVSRPLIWDDFLAKVPDSRYTAAVFPSFGYDLRRDFKNGVIRVNLAVKVYMVKSASWVRHGRQDNYALNHEQRHFDLVKLIAERFKEKLITEKLSPDNYEGIINYEYIEFYREMNRLQTKYDLETSHGSNAGMQREWNRSIDNDLAALIR